MPIWVVALCLALGLGTLGWMARAWLREWRAYRSGTLLPHHKFRPVPPTIQAPRSPWRFLIYAAQAAAIGGLAYTSYLGTKDNPGDLRIAAISLAIWAPLVAFATAVLTALTDWTARSARKVVGRAAGRPGPEQPE